MLKCQKMLKYKKIPTMFKNVKISKKYQQCLNIKKSKNV